MWPSCTNPTIAELWKIRRYPQAPWEEVTVSDELQRFRNGQMKFWERVSFVLGLLFSF